GFYKVNIDEAWNKELFLGGIVVVRDSNGIFVNGVARRDDFMHSPIHAEALAFRDGLVLKSTRGSYKVIFKNDSLQIISALRDPVIDISYIGHVIEDSKIVLRSITEASSPTFVVKPTVLTIA
ncbi:hypothetical protein C1H46_001245, partial [Malus baccata]